MCKSSSWLCSDFLWIFVLGVAGLSSFPVMDSAAEVVVGDVDFAARRARELFVLAFRRLLAHRRLSRRQRLHLLFRQFLAGVDAELPVVVRAD